MEHDGRSDEGRRGGEAQDRRDERRGWTRRRNETYAERNDRKWEQRVREIERIIQFEEAWRRWEVHCGGESLDVQDHPLASLARFLRGLE